jgi:2-phosphosulfolactate phosphatase
VSTSLEVTFTPAEFAAFGRRDLGQTVAVVFDVLRATTTMITALSAGAERMIPVAEIAEALALRRANPGLLLAGERDGLRIGADLTDGVEFELGNSPREFTPDRVRGRTMVMTTTNGTRALRACAGALRVLVGGFVNLGALARLIERHRPARLLLVCSGTLEQAALEDALAAGALADLVWPLYADGQVADSAQIARQLYRQFARDLPAAMRLSRNGRRLLDRAELRDDVPFCLQRDVTAVVGEMQADGAVRPAVDASWA